MKVEAPIKTSKISLQILSAPEMLCASVSICLKDISGSFETFLYMHTYLCEK